MKTRLEEAQRARRKELEVSAKSWRPRWFTRVDAGPAGNEVKLKRRKEGCWEERARGELEGVIGGLRV